MKHIKKYIKGTRLIALFSPTVIYYNPGLEYIYVIALGLYVCLEFINAKQDIENFLKLF